MLLSATYTGHVLKLYSVSQDLSPATYILIMQHFSTQAKLGGETIDLQYKCEKQHPPHDITRDLQINCYLLSNLGPRS